MPDGLRIFPDLTCEENLEIARRLSGRSGYWNRERVEAIFPVLGERPRQMGLNLFLILSTAGAQSGNVSLLALSPFF